MGLDPDDPRPPYQQVASVLRDAITDGTLQPGEKLPSGTELATRHSVSRMTVQNAIRVLRHEGLVVTRQGSGMFVRARPTSGSDAPNEDHRLPSVEVENRITYRVGRVAMTASRLEMIAAQAYAALLDSDAAELVASGQNWGNSTRLLPGDPGLDARDAAHHGHDRRVQPCQQRLPATELHRPRILDSRTGW